MNITTKDLHFLSDELSWELIAMKKCHHYAKECQDPQIKQVIESTGQMHQKHYETLLSLLQSATNSTGNTNAGQ